MWHFQLKKTFFFSFFLFHFEAFLSLESDFFLRLKTMVKCPVLFLVLRPLNTNRAACLMPQACHLNVRYDTITNPFNSRHSSMLQQIALIYFKYLLLVLCNYFCCLNRTAWHSISQRFLLFLVLLCFGPINE